MPKSMTLGTGLSSCSVTSTLPGLRSRWRSEEHTSELQSRQYLVCRLLLEKKKNLVRHLIIVPQEEELDDLQAPRVRDHLVPYPLLQADCSYHGQVAVDHDALAEKVVRDCF